MTLAPEAKEVLNTIILMLILRRADLPSTSQKELLELEYNILSIAERYDDDMTDEEMRVIDSIRWSHLNRMKMRTHDPND